MTNKILYFRILLAAFSEIKEYGAKSIKKSDFDEIIQLTLLKNKALSDNFAIATFDEEHLHKFLIDENQLKKTVEICSKKGIISNNKTELILKVSPIVAWFKWYI